MACPGILQQEWTITVLSLPLTVAHLLLTQQQKRLRGNYMCTVQKHARCLQHAAARQDLENGNTHKQFIFDASKPKDKCWTVKNVITFHCLNIEQIYSSDNNTTNLIMMETWFWWFDKKHKPQLGNCVFVVQNVLSKTGSSFHSSPPIKTIHITEFHPHLPVLFVYQLLGCYPHWITKPLISYSKWKPISTRVS